MTTSSLATGFDESQFLTVLTALKDGDFTRRMPAGGTGTAGEIAETFNALLDQLRGFEAETEQITHEIGTEGRFGGQAEVPGISGSWKNLLNNINFMSANLTEQVRDISQTAHALVAGDTSQRVTSPADGETADLKEAINKLAERHGRPGG